MPVKILIADDEPNQLELLSYNLVQAGFDVAQAHDGQAAMTMIEDWHPDLVVLDWMMPHMSGIELCRILRSRTDTKLLPIIILSARGEEGDPVRGSLEAVWYRGDAAVGAAGSAAAGVRCGAVGG